MNDLTHTTEIDLALVKRDAARQYVRTRYVLRAAVRLGIFTREEARATRAAVVEHRTTWRAARSLLKG